MNDPKTRETVMLSGRLGDRGYVSRVIDDETVDVSVPGDWIPFTYSNVKIIRTSDGLVEQADTAKRCE